MIMKMCVMGTPFGTKMMEAKMKCMAPMESRKAKAKAKAKNHPNVPPLMTLLKKLLRKCLMICIFQELGWMDAEYNEDEAMYMADIASLPSNVSAALDSDDDFEECYMMVEAAMDAKMNKDKQMKKCYNKMSDEDKAKLNEVGEFIAGTVCFKKNFMKACT